MNMDDNSIIQYTCQMFTSISMFVYVYKYICKYSFYVALAETWDFVLGAKRLG